MAVFAYIAIDGGSAPVTGTILADTPRQARDLLRGRGLVIQDVSPLRDGPRRAWGRASRHGWLPAWRPTWRGGGHAARVTGFVGELATLLGVGIPLVEALDTIARQHRGPFKSVVLMLRERVAGGASLAEAMRQQSAVFDELCVSMIEVGQNAGNLEEVLEQLATFKQRWQNLKNRLVTALIYPCIVLCTGAAVSVFLMTFVVPRLLQSLLDAGKPLPLATRLVKGASDALVHHWPVLVVVAVVLVLVAAAVRRWPRGRAAWHRLLLRLPVVGDMARKQAIVRIAMVVSTLMRSGVVFEAAVRIAADTTPNLVLRGALAQCQTAVSAGRDIGPALEQTGAFGPVVVQVFTVGQQSGRLEPMLDRLASDYDRQVAAASQRLAAVMEPALVIILAVVVGLIAMATVMPILEAGHVL